MGQRVGPVCRATATLLFLLVSASAPARSRPASRQSDVVIRLVEQQPLRLGLVDAEDGSKVPMLEGTLAATIHNRSRQTITLLNWNVHNLLFVNKRDGSQVVMIHPCSCGQAMWAPDPEAPLELLTLRPGERRTIVLDNWGCDGGPYAPPAPGEYRITYRVHSVESHRVQRSQIQTRSLRKLPLEQALAECSRLLHTQKYWTNAYLSNIITVRLRSAPSLQRHHD